MSSEHSAERFSDWTIAGLSREMVAGAISSKDIVEECLRRIHELDGDINAFCAIDEERVRADAVRADELLASGGPLSPLHGIPVAVKDLIFVAGLPMTGGSVLYRDLIADEDDAAVVRLREAGAIVLGKTNASEFGFSANQTANAVHGTTRNPWSLGHSPGGSSGGAAAAVAAGMVPGALASDGGGSIRIPASFCGLAGLKPTFGRVPMYPGCRDPRYPGLSGWESIEHLGPIARTAQDAALLLDAMSGFDARDRHSLPGPTTSFAAGLQGSGSGLSGVRVGLTLDWAGSTPVEPWIRERVAAAARGLADRGATVTDADVEVPESLDAFGIIVALDSDPSVMRDFLAAGGDAVNDRVVQIMARDHDYVAVAHAMALRRELYLAVNRLLETHDVLVLPTVPIGALRIGEHGPETIDGRPVDDRARAVIRLTHMFNLTGHPAMTIPCGLDSKGLPIGLQVVGGRLREDLVLRVAAAIEVGNPLPAPAAIRGSAGRTA